MTKTILVVVLSALNCTGARAQRNYNIDGLRHPRKIRTMPEMSLYIKSARDGEFTFYQVATLAMDVKHVVKIHRPLGIRWHPQREVLLVTLSQGQTIFFSPNPNPPTPLRLILDKLSEASSSLPHLLDALDRLYEKTIP